jgi:hypothetical protein
MSQPLRSCRQCNQSYWATSLPSADAGICPHCADEAALAATDQTRGAEPGRRFATLSSLPPEQRFPIRRDVATPSGETVAQPHGLIVPRRLAMEQRQQMPSVNVSLPEVRESAAMARTTEGRQLGFNCPSCFTVLIIKDPQNYDGRPAPCPFCAVTIIPPRVAPATPFTLIAAPQGTPDLPAPARQSRWRPFGKRIAETQRVVPNRRIVPSEAVA